MSARITAKIIASGEPITVKLDTAARGPAGADGTDGPAGPNAVTSATTSDGTANLSVATITSQGAVLVNPEFDDGIIAEESSVGRSVFRVGGIIISAAEGSVTCVQVDTATVNTTTLRASSTEYANNATFSYGNATAVANHLTALGAGATGVDVFQAATAGDARDAMGLGTGDNPVFNTLKVGDSSTNFFGITNQNASSGLWVRGGSGFFPFIGTGPTNPVFWVGTGNRPVVRGRLAFGLSNAVNPFGVPDTVIYRDSPLLLTVGNENDGDFSGSMKMTNLEAVGDIEASTIGKGVILKSPNGTRYRITVENDGTLTTTAI